MSTIRQVAKACGVSPMTVSFVLNNKRGQVGEDTRDRVLQAVRDLGYRPRAVHREPRTDGRFTFGLVCGVRGDSYMQPGYYHSVLNGLLTVTDARQHNITIFSSLSFSNDALEAIRIYCDGRCDGLIVVAPNCKSATVDGLRERGFPFVVIGDTSTDPAISYADLDNPAAGRLMTQYLLDSGHRRIGFAGGPDFVRSATDRLGGYFAALAEAGITPDPSHIIYGDEVDGAVMRWGRVLFSRPAAQRPTAIVCWTDGAAYQIMDAAHAAGLDLPRELSVISVDNEIAGARTDPPLTSVRQPMEKMCAGAVDNLERLIRSQDERPVDVLLPGELVVRKSVCPPPPQI